ncbi:SDR family NAD(P)-dependent oxidoreductase [Haloplanus litoreus]|uniref:SDR family NAD(P)-dependent oxidoreductase n=1 Tax=Haloplanus litoreus TaxID=767515 RepID=A0ABD6A2P2_9EURY
MAVGAYRVAVSDEQSTPAAVDYEPISAEGSTVVVVGGTSGIGRAISLAFATEGANVVPTSRSEERVDETAEAVRERGGEALAVTCDVTDRESLDALADAAVERFGTVDTLVNSPGAIARAAVSDVTDDEWDRVLDVQLTGVHRTVQTFVTRTDVESVVNIASLSALLGIENLAAYSAAKGGIDGYTHAAAKDLGPDVRVNAVRPGFVSTPQTADAYAEGSHRYERILDRASIGRIGRPEDIAGAVVYLSSPAASYVTGETITVDGGFTPSAF